MKSANLARQLQHRMDKIQKEIDKLKGGREKIDRKLKEAQSRMNIWRQAYEMEVGRTGKPRLPISTKEDKTYRFAGMRLVDALALVRQEQAGITKEQAHKILVEEGFNFRTGRSRNAVHFAWVALDNRKKRG
jgi:hypothetical protein